KRGFGARRGYRGRLPWLSSLGRFRSAFKRRLARSSRPLDTATPGGEVLVYSRVRVMIAKPSWMLALFLLSGRPALAQDDHIPQATRPPPSSLEYLVTGIALSAETVASPADMCPDDASDTPCIIERGLG